MADTVTIRVAHGDLLGKKVITDTGLNYYSFQGIPYAKPPVGPLRFKAPQPPDSWAGVRNALIEGSVAPNIDDFLQKEYIGDEDCLFLNVYMPKLPSNTVIPVMVWIHGGGFYTGSGNSNFYGPDHLIKEDVILVTINYRLGALGFLSTGDSVIPGNNGLKDQVMALRWVKQNISQFGGDPDNVTVFGESAGGASVHLQLLSPMSKGLFHRAIAQSGSALNPWAFDDPSVARKKAFRFGKALGITTTESIRLFQFLKTKSARELVEGMNKSLTEEEKHPLSLCFAPTNDSSAIGEEVFLPDCPDNIITEGKFHMVPFIIGVDSNEGMFVVKDFCDYPSWYESLNKEFRLPVPHKLNVSKNTDMYKGIADEVKKFYFGSKPISKETWPQLANLYSDMWFIYGITKSIQKQALLSPEPIFLYNFAYDGQLGFVDAWLGPNRLSGACHGEEVGYLFQANINKEMKFDSESENMKVLSRMVKMWTNFAKTGNPTPTSDCLLEETWYPATRSELNYLNIDGTLKMKKHLLKERMDFWDKIFETLVLPKLSSQ